MCSCSTSYLVASVSQTDLVGSAADEATSEQTECEILPLSRNFAKTMQPGACPSCLSAELCQERLRKHLQKGNGKPGSPNPLHPKTRVFLPIADFFNFSLLSFICCFYVPGDPLCEQTCGSPRVSCVFHRLSLRQRVPW